MPQPTHPPTKRDREVYLREHGAPGSTRPYSPPGPHRHRLNDGQGSLASRSLSMWRSTTRTTKGCCSYVKEKEWWGVLQWMVAAVGV
jgi:hypothetical protein